MSRTILVTLGRINAGLGAKAAEIAGGTNMAYAFQQDVPINMDIYRTIVERLGETPPEGLIVHLVIEQEHGLRYIDVWESQALHQRFVDQQLHPIIGDVLRNAGFATMPPEPETVPLEVTDVWGAAGRLVSPAVA
jgi:hypothetical protein